MRTPYIIAALGCIFILAVVLIAGCTGSPGTSVATHTIVVPETTPSTPGIVPSQTTLPASPAVAVVAANVSGKTFRTVYVNSTANGQIVTIPVGDRVLVRLNENPTTGYTWNATAAKGLAIISDNYIAPDTTLTGAPGYHDWLLSPGTVDTYTFKAVYHRPWEAATAADKTFSMVILVTKD
jgi:predicted secreted protein